MKRIYALLAFLTLVSHFGFGQEMVGKERKKLQQLYIGVGPGFTVPFGPDMQKGSFSIGNYLNLSFSETVFFRGGLTYAKYNDSFRGLPTYNYTGDSPPQHELYSYFVGIGKRRNLSPYTLLQTTAGISLNRHFIPKDISFHPGYVSLFGITRDFDYGLEKKVNPGFILQTEFLFQDGEYKASKFAGGSAGIYFHYIPLASNGGLIFTFNLGLQSQKWVKKPGSNSVKQT